MEPEAVRQLRRDLGLTQSAFAQLLGVHVVTVKKWETRAQPTGPLADRLLQILAQPGLAQRVVPFLRNLGPGEQRTREQRTERSTTKRRR